MDSSVLDPHLIRVLVPQMASRLVQLLCAPQQRLLSSFQWAGKPQIIPSLDGSGPHLIHDSLGPPESATQTASRYGSAIFTSLTHVTNRHTHTDRLTTILSLQQ